MYQYKEVHLLSPAMWCYDILPVWVLVRDVRQSSEPSGTHGVCAKQFCTSIPVCPMGDLIPCTCADIQILQRALVALIRIAHGRTILRFIYAMLAYLRYSPGTSGPDPFGLEIITW